MKELKIKVNIIYKNYSIRLTGNNLFSVSKISTNSKGELVKKVIVSSVDFVRAVEIIINKIIVEKLQETETENINLIAFYKIVKQQKQDFSDFLKTEILGNIYDYPNVICIYFNSMEGLIKYKSYDGKKIVQNSDIIYEGIESECNIDNYLFFNSLFLDKDMIYTPIRYILILKAKK